MAGLVSAGAKTPCSGSAKRGAAVGPGGVEDAFGERGSERHFGDGIGGGGIASARRGDFTAPVADLPRGDPPGRGVRRAREPGGEFGDERFGEPDHATGAGGEF